VTTNDGLFSEVIYYYVYGAAFILYEAHASLRDMELEELTYSYNFELLDNNNISTILNI
jgi:sulfur relay (sulfurtransferase) DsrF/TusC family protein